MILPIYTYDAPVLREQAKPVSSMNEEIVALIADMFETMKAARGIGLAANQVGKLHAVCLVDLSELEEEDFHKPLFLINPVIVDSWGEEIVMEEGCLSLPELREDIRRPEFIAVRFKDTRFEDQELEASGLLARVIQHEVDHLNGIYFTDYLTGFKKTIVKSQLNKIKKGEVETDYPVIVNGEIIPA